MLLFSLPLLAGLSPQIAFKNKGTIEMVNPYSVKTKVQLYEAYATIRYEFVFKNPHPKLREGKFLFPLQPGQKIRQFFLDVNGKLQPAATVEAEKARTAYESQIRRRIDPALLEWTGSNTFSLRIYPFPAKGTRRVVLETELPLLKTRNGYIHKPFFEWPESVASEIEYVNNVQSISPHKGQIVYQETISDSTYFEVHSPVLSISNQRAARMTPVKQLNILWDESFSMQERNRDREYAFVKELLHQVKPQEVNILTFSTSLSRAIRFKKSKTLKNRVLHFLKSRHADGGSDLSALHPDSLPSKGLTLLFSDGNATLGTLSDTIQYPSPIHCISSSPWSNKTLLEKIAKKSKAHFVDLHSINGTQQIKGKVTRLFSDNWVLHSVEYDSSLLHDVYPKPGAYFPPEQERVLFYGKTKPNASSKAIPIIYSLKKSGTSTPAFQDTLWYRNKQASNIDGSSKRWAESYLNSIVTLDEHKKEITALGLQYQLVTPFTSMLVLETLQDYITYEIEPPQKDWQIQWKKAIEAKRLKAHNDSIQQKRSALNEEMKLQVEAEKNFTQYWNEFTHWQEWYKIAFPFRFKIQSQKTDFDSIHADSSLRYKFTLEDNDGKQYQVDSTRVRWSESIIEGAPFKGGFKGNTWSPLSGLKTSRVQADYNAFGLPLSAVQTLIVPGREVDSILITPCMSEQAGKLSIDSILKRSAEKTEVKNRSSCMSCLQAHAIDSTGRILKEYYWSDAPIQWHFQNLRSGGSSDLPRRLKGNYVQVQHGTPYNLTEVNATIGKTKSSNLPLLTDFVEENPMQYCAEVGVQPSFNSASSIGGSGGIGDMLDGLLGGGASSISTKARGNIRNPSLNLNRQDSTPPRFTAKEWTPSAPYLDTMTNSRSSQRVSTYLRLKKDYLTTPAFYVDMAHFFDQNGQTELAYRILTNLAELRIESHRMLRILGNRQLILGRTKHAQYTFQKVRVKRPEEPQSYRDLAKAYSANQNLDSAFTTYVSMLSKAWPERHGNIPQSAFKELSALSLQIPKAKEQLPLPDSLKNSFSFDTQASDIRIVLEWDTDHTDIDLWVFEPGGQQVNYSNPRSYWGGFLSKDVTSGYGPEEYWIKKAQKGTYSIYAKYYGSNVILEDGPATLTLTIYEYWGTNKQKIHTLTRRLEKGKDKIHVGDFEFLNLSP